MFEKFILKRAEKIKGKQKAKQDKKDQEWKAYREKVDSITKQAKDILYQEIDTVATKMKPHPEYVKEGDRAILNIYRMLFSRDMDGWDGGANALKSHSDIQDRPIFVMIKNVSIDKSYAYEAADRFVEKTGMDELEIMINSPVTLLSLFRAYLDKSKYTGFGLSYGLYFSATFSTEGSFKPVWGLSLTCFLKEGTDAAKETEAIWKEEIEIEKTLKDLSDRRKAVEARQREINERYRNIRIISDSTL